MPLGSFRINSLARYVAPEAPAGRTAKTVTAYGDAQVDTLYSQFGGASAYLDGTGDYLEVSDPSGDFLFGTSSDFTIEFWYRKNTTNTTEQMASNRGGYDVGNWYIQFDSTTDKIQWGVNGAAAQRSTSTYDDTNWHHLAITRSGTTFTLWIDGSSQGTLSGSYQWGRSGDAYMRFGRIGTADGNISVDEIRVSDTARYTTGFTAPTEPFTNDANTLVLVHCDGTDGSTVFTDDVGDRTAVGISAYGDAQVDTTYKKFGTGSVLFDGTGDYLQTGASSDWELGTTNDVWTIEGWVYYPSLQNSFHGLCHAAQIGTQNGWSVYVNGSNQLVWKGGAQITSVTSSTAFSATTWQHWAVVRENTTTVKLYLDGTQVASTTGYSDKNDPTVTPNLYIGYAPNISTNYTGALYHNGQQDEIRISHSARYTTGFTPSTSAFTNDADTVLLIHADGTDTSTDFADDNS